MQFPEIILASASPRRKLLCEAAGIPCRIMPLDVNEDFPAEMDVHEVAEFLARKKGHAAMKLFSDMIILTADSVVIHENIILGKPGSRVEAMDMIGKLQGDIHEVMTGICLIHDGQAKSASALTKVEMAEMSAEEIAYYVDTFKPYDKAGAYGIQEWIGLCKVKSIEGSYTNVVGLPVQLVYKMLQEITS